MSDHVHAVRVYFEDTDAAGLVYHANYLCFAERARTEMLRSLSYPHCKMMAEGTAFVVRSLAADYLRPARLDDVLEIHSTVREVGGATVRLTQTVRRGGEDLVRMEVRLACVRLDDTGVAGAPARVPEALRQRFRGASE